MIIGTPQYMPPEQLEGKRPTPANDLWALGATLYHAVEGCPPFDAEGLHALAIAVFNRPQRPPTQAKPADLCTGRAPHQGPGPPR